MSAQVGNAFQYMLEIQGFQKALQHYIRYQVLNPKNLYNKNTYFLFDEMNITVAMATLKLWIEAPNSITIGVGSYR